MHSDRPQIPTKFRFRTNFITVNISIIVKLTIRVNFTMTSIRCRQTYDARKLMTKLYEVLRPSVEERAPSEIEFRTIMSVDPE